jgi:hypothetical protein
LASALACSHSIETWNSSLEAWNHRPQLLRSWPPQLWFQGDDVDSRIVRLDGSSGSKPHGPHLAPISAREKVPLRPSWPFDKQKPSSSTLSLLFFGWAGITHFCPGRIILSWLLQACQDEGTEL